MPELQVSKKRGMSRGLKVLIIILCIILVIAIAAIVFINIVTKPTTDTDPERISGDFTIWGTCSNHDVVRSNAYFPLSFDTLCCERVVKNAIIESDNGNGCCRYYSDGFPFRCSQDL